MKEFFELNNKQDTEPTIVWDAGKAVIRVFYKAKCLTKKRKREGKNDLLEEIKRKQKELNKYPNNEKIKKEIKLLQSEYVSKIEQEIEWNLKTLK